MIFGNVVRLENYERKYGEGPGDKFVFFREVLLDGNGEAVINFDGILKPGAQIDYFMLNRTGVNNTDGASFGASSATINSGGLGISTAAVAAAAPVPANVIPAANARVMVMVVANVDDIADSGD